VVNKVSFIIQLKDQFGRTAEKVKKQFNGIKASSDKANQSISAFAKNAKASLKSFGQSATKTGAIMTAALTVPIGLLGKNMINAASAAEEVATKFDQIFKGAKNSSEAVKGLSESYKLSNTSAKEMLSTTGAMLSAAGIEKDRILEMSQALAGASIDLASFNDFKGSATDASMILAKALLGEAEMLKTNFSIQIPQNKQFQESVKMRMRLKGETLEAAKAEVMFSEILRKAGKDGQDALGDFNRTIEGYANQTRVLAEQKKAVAIQFGAILLPVANKFIGALIKLGKFINSLSPAMKKFVVVLVALAAILPPIVLALGAIAIAASAITLPLLLVSAGVLALIAAGVLLVKNWESIKSAWQGTIKSMSNAWIDFQDKIGGTIEQIGINFSLMWGGVKEGLNSFVNFAISQINGLLSPISFVAEKLNFGSISIPQLNKETRQAPQSPTKAMNGSINGTITVAAAQGTEVKNTSLKTMGAGLNVGTNLVTQ